MQWIEMLRLYGKSSLVMICWESKKRLNYPEQEQQMFTMPVFFYLLKDSVILLRVSHEICKETAIFIM